VVTPIKVGVLTTNVKGVLAAFGASTDATPENNYKALIRELNLKGGLSGRRIVPTYKSLDATGNNYQQLADEGCATFKDAKVEVVLSESGGTDYGIAACLQKASIPVIAVNQSDNVGIAGAPWLFNPFNPSYDRGYAAVVDHLVASGYVTPKSKIGVVRIHCPEIDRAYARTVLPRMKAARLATPIEYTVNCIAGFGDAGALATAMQSAVLRFRSAGVDRVFFIGGQENTIVSFFAQNAENQGYHPGFAVSSKTYPRSLIGAPTFPAGQLAQVHGVGWHPLGDVGVETPVAADKRCAAMATKGGVTTQDPITKLALYQSCANVFLLEAAVRKGDGSATGPALRAAVPALAASFQAPGIIAGTTVFSAVRRDAPELARELTYATSCECFRYLGQPRVMR
jgi:ABC-type branched-subunit amino acid transport system substrate-binding protein